MIVTNENYFDKETEKELWGSSSFKSMMECPAKFMAELNGEITREVTDSMLIGSYVDAHFEGTLDTFKMKNPQIFTKKMELKSEYRKANYIIERIESDNNMMKFLSGKKQIIKTGEIEGVKFKTKIDSYHEGLAIVDLKVMKDFAPMWRNKVKLNFVEFWKYDLQGAIYQAIEGNNLPFYIAAATKEKEPDMLLIQIPQDRLDAQIEQVKEKIKFFDKVKKGQEKAIRCEKCNYCRKTRQAPLVSFNELDEYIGGVLD
jgi:hypothetical protein